MKTRYPLLAASALVLTFVVLFAEAIENGRDATEGEYPYVYHLGFTRSSLGGDIPGTCTGTLVHPRLILTAAHCFGDDISRDVNTLTTVSNELRIPTEKQFQRSTVSVDSTRAHPKYRTKSKKTISAQGLARHLDDSAPSDIAYVKLSRDAPVRTFPKLEIDRPGFPNSRFQNFLATLVGYGSDRFTPGNARNYSGAGTKRVGEHSIANATPNYYLLRSKDQNFLVGDSGGPLLVVENGRTLMLGHAHTILPGTDLETTTNRRGKKRTRKVVSYFGSVVTAYSYENLCWVERESGIDLPDVDCPKSVEDERKKKRRGR